MTIEAKPTKVSVDIDTKYGNFIFSVFRFGDLRDLSSELEVAVAILGKPSNTVPLVRVHSECLTGDVFGSLMCDCGDQLRYSFDLISKCGTGVIIYLRQEGRGIGLFEKVRAYALQATGVDTVDANLKLGYPADLRTYSLAGIVLNQLGIGRIRLLTNNPQKVKDIEGCNIEVERVPCIVGECESNSQYLHTKKTRMGHLFR